MIGKSPLTGAVLRGARNITGMSAEQLAQLAQVGVATVRRAEATENEPATTPANQAALCRALEYAGVRFIERPGAPLGVAPRVIRFEREAPAHTIARLNAMLDGQAEMRATDLSFFVQDGGHGNPPRLGVLAELKSESDELDWLFDRTEILEQAEVELLLDAIFSRPRAVEMHVFLKVPFEDTSGLPLWEAYARYRHGACRPGITPKDICDLLARSRASAGSAEPGLVKRR